MSQAISVEFQVNDLTASYELHATSDNHSFQKDLGIGSDLVDFEGDSFSQVIPLNKKYGVFDVRVFAVSDVGVRSPSITGRVEVFPDKTDSTFTFGSIVSSDPTSSEISENITIKSPQQQGDLFVNKSQFEGKELQLSWSLVPPDGHSLEGGQITNELLSDTFFSGFKVNFKKDDQLVDLYQIQNDTDALSAIAASIYTEESNVVDALQNYRSFNLLVNQYMIESLNLERDFSVELVSVDKFGREATGIINLSNPEPVIENLNYSINGSQLTFSWFVNDVDYSHVDVNVLAIPSSEELFFDDDLEGSALFYQQMQSAKDYNEFKNVSYLSGDLAVYEGNVYHCESNHQRINLDENPTNSSNWSLRGKQIDFKYFSSPKIDLSEENQNLQQDNKRFFSTAQLDKLDFSIDQIWGYKYYYTIQPYDKFGAADIYNVTSNGLVRVGGPFSELKPFESTIKISNFRYRELNDDLVFNWDITDQDGNPVDLNQYKFSFSDSELPSLLGISGSLYDVDTNQKIMSITDGFNSKSVSFDDDGNSFVESNLPSARVFDQYKYTRELNNQIYGTGGFPSSYKIFETGVAYEIGEKVTSSQNYLYDCLLETNEQDPYVRPEYKTWSPATTYRSSTKDVFEYNGNIFKANVDFGPNSDNVSGLFNEYEIYPSGAIIVAPSQSIEVYDAESVYYTDQFVFYSGSLYKCIKDLPQEVDNNPSLNREFWSVASAFDEINCSYFRSKIDDNVSLPFANASWEKMSPDKLIQDGYFDLIVPSYEHKVSNWQETLKYNSGDFVVYSNDVWSGTQASIGEVPDVSSSYWSNQSNLQNIGEYSSYLGRNYLSGDLVYSNHSVYKCTNDNPVGGPILAETNSGDLIYSSYSDSNWQPYWQKNKTYDNIIFGHIGIPQSGKRSVGLELGIIDSDSKVLKYERLAADNPPPYILSEGFNVDSLSEATKVKFNFNYALGFQEKTTKVYLYRSEDPVFDVVDEYGFPLTGEDTTFVKSVVGAGDATFGQNITQIIDEPPIPSINGVDQITGYYYKILPFDDFGSGVLYEASDNQGVLEKILVYPKRYNSPNPDVMPGRVVRADPTEAAGAVPGPVLGLSGVTAFENFFLNWRAPNSEYEIGSNTLLKQKQNDIDHYEVWASDDSVLYTGDSQGNANPWEQAENTGYRKIQGAAYSVGEIPQEFPDPALTISGAENIFNVPANSPSIETSYPGITNQQKNFWVRAVDFGGNKSPFTGRNINPGEDILGLSLIPGQASATDISDFEVNMTEKFGNSVALVPNNPFSSNSPVPGEISWMQHVLYYQGTGYFINAGNTNSGYVWWDADLKENPGNYQYGALKNIYYSGDYKLSDAHPQGGYDSNNEYIESLDGFEDTDFIIARNSNGAVSPVYYAFPNALIGTANIAEAAIVDAKINDLAADKITAGEIKSADIQIGTTNTEAGVVRSAGFTGIDSTPSRSGFYLSGDGTFAFQAGGSSLSFEDDSLVLKGKLRQTNGFDYDFIDLDVTPNYFNYVQAEYYEDQTPNVETFIPDDGSPTELSIAATFRNSSVTDTGVRFRMDAVSGNNRINIFGYNDFYDNPSSPVDGGYNISGFIYNTNDFIDESITAETKIANATLALGRRNDGNPTYGFDYIIDEAFPGSGLADSVILYVSGINSTYEKSITITRINDGRVGRDGVIGADGNYGLSPTYRGAWDTNIDYVFEASTASDPGRGDIVEYINTDLPSQYFISVATPNQGNPPVQNGSLNSSYWREFGAELENIATNLLLTNEAYITDRLIIGKYGFSGAIVSNGFTGGLIDTWQNPYSEITQESDENYENPGFLLARTDDGVYFDIGGRVKDDAGNDIQISSNRYVESYMRFDASQGKIEMRGASINNTSEEQISATLEVNNEVGGISNIKDNLATFVGGGYDNNIDVPTIGNSFLSVASAIVAGGSNNIEGRFSFIGAGFSGICNDNFSAIVAGYQNSMPQNTSLNQGANFIGAGQNNTINGGTNQTILGGDNNTIEYTL